MSIGFRQWRWQSSRRPAEGVHQAISRAAVVGRDEVGGDGALQGTLDTDVNSGADEDGRQLPRTP